MKNHILRVLDKDVLDKTHLLNDKLEKRNLNVEDLKKLTQTISKKRLK